MNATTEEMIKKFVQNYERKKLDKTFSAIKVSVRNGEATEICYLIFKEDNSIELVTDENTEFDFGIKLSTETLEKLHSGKLAPVTAAGRANLAEPAPLDFELPPGKQPTMDFYHNGVQFIQRFFNPFMPEKILIDHAYTRKIHGADVVALFSGVGFRSAWYSVAKGDKLNAPGDTNPFPQAFIILSGKGQAKIGSDVVEIESNQAVFIPPYSEHIVWTEEDEPITLIWLAWGKGA